MKKAEKEKAVELRKLGYSYNEITRIVHVSKGILNLWLKSVELSDPAKQRIETRVRDNQLKLIHSNSVLSKQDKIERGEKIKQWIATLPESERLKREAFFREVVIPASQRSFTEDEKKVKIFLDTVFHTDFQKEPISGIVIDFANSHFVIEHTQDNGKGIAKALGRLSKVNDGRIRIIICPSYGFGPQRRGLLNGFHWPLVLFNEGVIPDNIKELIGM